MPGMMQTFLTLTPRKKTVVKVIAVAVVYYFAARLGLLLAFKNSNATPIWAPSGIAFAALLALGMEAWPGIWLGAFVANWMTFLSTHAVDDLSAGVLSIFVATGNTLEALLGAYWMMRVAKNKNAFFSVRDSFCFLVITPFMCLASSVVGVSTLTIGGVISPALSSTVWFTWWLGDVAGILIVTPCLVNWFFQPRWSMTREQELELWALAITIVVTGQALFGGWFPTSDISSLPFLIAPLLLWASFRLGPREASTAVVMVSAIAILGTIHGKGSFVRDELNVSLLLLQSFVCVIAVMNTAVAASVAERRVSQCALMDSNNALLRQSSELKQSNAALLRTNRELDEFAYVISHDLKAPLRGVASLASWLEQDYRDVLDNDGREQLQLMLARVKRMDNLINGVLEYSLIGRAVSKSAICNTDKIVRDVFDSLQPQPHFDMHIDGVLPAVEYDQIHLVQIFQNLIGNAIKHYGKPEGKIVVSCRDLGPHYEFCVRDHGIGIAPEYHERIFKLFQTLIPRDEKESTGIGLSLVKKIVESHGGKITLDSTVGEGAAFYFTITKNTGGDPGNKSA